MIHTHWPIDLYCLAAFDSLYDVGAQQSLKRKKWLGCFDCVQAVLFVVDLSGYDVNMMDDPSPGTHRVMQCSFSLKSRYTLT